MPPHKATKGIFSVTNTQTTMRRPMRIARFLFYLSFLLPISTVYAQTGKIAGIVSDATGEPLPGVNVVIEGTTQGSTTDLNGYYVILNVPPGTYELRASFVGFTSKIIEGVRVNIDLTAEVNFTLEEETVGLDEVVVSAARPVVQRDISASMANLDAERIENLPATSVTEVIGLQAGVRGLSVRGSDLEEVGFVVDGLSYSNPRDNTPFTGVSYTSISEVQVQTGGFNAEYGNVRAGLVNVVTKEGSPTRYSADVLIRYSPAQPKYDGIPFNDPRAYWWRPFFSELPEDGNVTMVGSESAESPWDPYLQRQYPKFDGWLKVSEQLLSDDDPTNDLTPEQAREVALFRRRKDFDIKVPDYEFDGTISGPVPGISRMLGDLRFVGSFRQTQNAFIVPQIRDGYTDRTGTIKLTSNIAPGMKVNLHGMLGRQESMANNRIGGTGMWTDGVSMAYELDEYGGRPIWANHLWNPMDVDRNLIGFDFTHTLGNATFYEVRAQRTFTKYHTFMGRLRDTTTIAQIGPMSLDEAPFGYSSESIYDFTNFRLSGDWHQARDSSEVTRYNLRFDFTSQLNQYMMIKTGASVDYSLYDTKHRQFDPVYPNQNQQYAWSQTPIQGAAYAQTKLEFKGMIANVGVRLDYFQSTVEGWYAHEDYERVFAPYLGYDELHQIDLEDVPSQLTFSPRVGVSFPVTETSKLFFNYGHFRQMLNPQNLYVIRQDFAGGINYVGNPRHPMPKTVQYELGYEHGLFDQYLIRMTGYYKALSDQTRNVLFQSADNLVNYYIGLPFQYEDIRGFEITLEKNRGRWFRGLINYTYMSTKDGFFGYDRYYENQVAQRQYVRDYRGHYQNKPVARPYARINLEFLLPPDFGPTVAGIKPLSDWRLNVLGNWIAGSTTTWTGGGGIEIHGLRNNVQWRGTKELDLRLSKNFDTGYGNAQFFMDVTNVLGLKSCCAAGFEGPNDYDDYVRSLHLPGDIFEDVQTLPPYKWIHGNDRLGDYRSYDVEFVPIEIVETVDEVKTAYERPLYFEEESGRYMWYRNGAFSEADPDFVEEVFDKKAYIDMPNQRSLVFLNPRRVRFGVRLSF